MKTLAMMLAAVVALLTAPPAGAQGLPAAKPEEVGLSSERLARIGAILHNDVERGRIPGAVIMVARRGRLAYVEAVGFRDKAAGAPMTQDAIFRIASMTKPMVSVAAMMLYEEGRLLMADPVSKYLPALAKLPVGIEKADPVTGKTVFYTVPAEREMTVQDLLRHTSGLPYGARGTSRIHALYPASSSTAAREMTATEFIDRLGKTVLLHQPGSNWEYGFSSDVLGRVVEVVSGKTLGQFLEERLFRPLRMPDTGFVVPSDKHARLAAGFATDPDTGKPVTLPDAKTAPKFECGGGCAVSTAGDYIRFAQMLANRGRLDGVRLLGRKTVEYMTSDHLGSAIGPGTDYIPGAGYGFGLGFAVRRAAGVADLNGSAGDFNWGGAYGTYFWVDPKEDLVVVSMTQAPGPIRVYYRHMIKSLVLQAIAD
jgi:CubicO group peptidase (beta-lactamase class C family)